MRFLPKITSAMAVCVGLTLAGCATDGSDAASNSTIVYSPPVSGPLAFLPVEVALSKGYFESEGLKVEKTDTSTGALPAAISGGQVHLSADVIYNSARYIESGIAVQYVAGLNDNVDFVLLRRPDVEVTEPGEGPDGWKQTFASLKGMKVGTAGKAGPIGLTVAALLKQAGVQEGQYTLIDTPGPVALNALDASQVDVVVSGGGFDAPIVANGLAEPVLNFGDGISSLFGEQSNAALFMTAEYLEQHPEAAAKIQAVIAKAVAYIADPANVDDVIAIATASGTVQTDVLRDRIAATEYNPAIDVAGVEAAFAWAEQADIISKPVDAASTIADGVETR